MTENVGGRSEREEIPQVTKISHNKDLYTERNRREEIITTKLRLDHTGLNGTMFLKGKSEVEECRGCGVKENVEHIILHCNMYKNREGKTIDRVREAGREWSLMGILGTEGEGVRATKKAILKYLRETGLIGRI